MSQVEPSASPGRERYTGWNAVVVVLLGLTLLGAGWLDARSYLLHRSRPLPDFDFLDPLGSERVVLDELYRAPDTFALLENIGSVEMHDPPRHRHAFGPASTILLTTYHPHTLLRVEFYNAIPDQDIAIRCNDLVVEQFPHQPVGVISRSYQLALRPGTNHISFGFGRYNHGPLDLGIPDPRPLVGGVFLKLDLNLE